MEHQQISFDFFANEPEKEKEVAKHEPQQKAVARPAETPEEKAELPIEAIIIQEEILIDTVVREIVFEPKVKNKKTLPVRKSPRGRMRLSDMDQMVGLIEVPADDVLFKKRYYTIGEVSNMFKVNISLVRFWENEFDILKPKKNGKGDRLFRPEDVKNLNLIYHLLREKKYTIDGAKDFLKKHKGVEERFELIDTLKKTKAFLLDLKAHL